MTHFAKLCIAFLMIFIGLETRQGCAEQSSELKPAEVVVQIKQAWQAYRDSIPSVASNVTTRSRHDDAETVTESSVANMGDFALRTRRRKSSQTIFVVNDDHYFRIERSSEAGKWQLSDLIPKSDSEKFEHALQLWFSSRWNPVTTGMTADSRSLLDMLEQGQLEITSARRLQPTENSNVEITLKRTGDEPGFRWRLLSGKVVLAPKNHWLIESGELKIENQKGDPGVCVLTNEYRAIPELDNKKAIVQHTLLQRWTQKRSGLRLVLSMSYSFEYTADLPNESDFRLSKFGIAEPVAIQARSVRE